MGSRVVFQGEDILRATVLKPAKYIFLVKKYQCDQAKGDGSDLHVFELVVDEGEYKGVPVRYQISEKAMGMGIEFIEACGFEVKAGTPIELDKMVGKKVKAFSQNKEYQGRKQNDLVTFEKVK